MTISQVQHVDWEALLNGVFRGMTVIEFGKDRNVFLQRNPAYSVFYIRLGKVKPTVLSPEAEKCLASDILQIHQMNP